MSTPSSAGWYENPDNPEELRYFDGILWTKNTTPLRKRPHVGPPTTPPASAGPQPRPAGWGPQPHQQTGHPDPGPGGPGQSGQQGWPGHSGQPGLSGVPGQPVLASFLSRVVAYIIDALVVGILALVFGGWLFWRAVEPAMDGFDAAMTSGDIEAMNAALTDVRLGYLVAFLGVQLILFLAYQVFCLTRWAATPGKLSLGISVRRLDRHGPLDVGTALRRAGFQAVVQAMGNLPYFSLLGTVAWVADLVWPLADDKNQALHDKVAKTIVIKGRVQR